MARTAVLSLRILNNGVLVGVGFNTIDLTGSIAGTDEGNGVIDFNATGTGGGGGGVTILPIAGTVDDSNVTFTASSKPVIININGAFYEATGGAITWTYVGGTITLSSPVGVNGQIYGLVASTDATVTYVRDEEVSGSGTSFTLAHAPQTNTLQLFRDGQRISVTNGDYTITSTAITLATALSAGETLVADYLY